MISFRLRPGHVLRALVVSLVLLGMAAPAWAQAQAVASATRVTSPKEQFGFAIGDDYQLATYEQLSAYWARLDAESDRMSLVDIGKTAEGRTQWMAIITSPENHRKLGRLKDIARRLARAEDVATDAEARALAAEGKAVVWIDGGLHANETLGAQQLIETVHQLVSGDDAETRRILDDVVVLAVHANPDGHDLVANWYLRERDPLKRSLDDLPRLYQKYAGHDNNRDSYMSALAETANMNRVLYREWFPQIVYNHHQTGPIGTVMFAPPFRDPFNYVYDPLVPTSLDLVGAAMHTRFAAEGKPGVTTRRGANYSTWWNGGLRTTVYFHNMIGLLTETIGNPTPMEIPFRPERALPSNDLPFPITPQTWHMRQSVDYSLTANRAVLDLASRYREQFLFNIWRMGRNAIERGQRDTWTTYPRRVQKVQQAAGGAVTGPAARRAGGAPRALFDTVLRDPALRDPRGYVLPADQADFPTAITFTNALIRAGVTVHRATAPFTAGGASYPAGSIVVKMAQAFRPHVLDMFEPQDHPDDFQYPGGPPIPPYDSAGWTLAFQMGIRADRILEAFDGPFEQVADELGIPPGRITGPASSAAFAFPHTSNQAFRAINRLLKQGETIEWLPDGRFRVPATPRTRARLEDVARVTGVSFEGTTREPVAGSRPVSPVRLALWDRYGGSMPSGWLRLVLEQFEFPYEVVYTPQIDAGGLAGRFDVLVLPDGAIPEGSGFSARMPRPESVPEEYRSRLGAYSGASTLPQLKAFLEGGGAVLAIGGSTSLARHLGVPIGNKLVDAKGAALPEEAYYIPGSILRVKVDAAHPIAHGLASDVDVYFDNSPVFTLPADAAAAGLTPIAWFDGPAPLRSGWAWGQDRLQGGVAIAEARVGKGALVLFGPEITFRSQPHGTFKFLFNGILRGAGR
jgi:hypothetical protein